MAGQAKINKFLGTNIKILPKIEDLPPEEPNWMEYKFRGDNSTKSERFGFSIAMSKDGNCIVAGSPGGGAIVYGNNQIELEPYYGEAYVFSWNGFNWVESEKLPDPPNLSIEDHFGFAVAINHNGSKLFSSSIEATHPSLGGERGVVYEYTKTGNNWINTNFISPTSGNAFGGAITSNFSGDVIVIGSPRARVGFSYNQGRLHVANYDGNNWNLTMLNPSRTGSYYRFGYVVDIADDGNTLIASSPGSGVSYLDPNIVGLVHVFKNNLGIWSEETVLEAPDGVNNDFYGGSAAISGDGNYIAVGAPNHNFSGLPPGMIGSPATGVIYIYKNTGSSWVQEAKILPELPTTYYRFAASIKINNDGSLLIVGVDAEDYGFIDPAKGPIYIYERNGSNWNLKKQLNSILLDPDYSSISGFFGNQVAINSVGTRIAVGAEGGPSDDGGATMPGDVHVFHKP